MVSLIPSLFVAFLIEQLYALNFHFPHPPSGLVYPHSLQLLKTLSVIATLTAWKPIMDYPTATPVYLTTPPSICFLASLGLFAWTATEARPRQLSVIYGRVTPNKVLSSGPFAHVRHPTYVAYALGWIGAVIHVFAVLVVGGATDRGWMPAPIRVMTLVASVLGLFWLYRRGAVLEEQQFLQNRETVEGQKVGEDVRVEYLAYVRQVGSRWIAGVI